MSSMTLGVSSALTKVVVPVLAAGLVIPEFAQEADQQTRQQIEAVQMKWVEAVNTGDVDACIHTRAGGRPWTRKGVAVGCDLTINSLGYASQQSRMIA